MEQPASYYLVENSVVIVDDGASSNLSHKVQETLGFQMVDKSLQHLSISEISKTYEGAVLIPQNTLVAIFVMDLAKMEAGKEPYFAKSVLEYEEMYPDGIAQFMLLGYHHPGDEHNTQIRDRESALENLALHLDLFYMSFHEDKTTKEEIEAKIVEIRDKTILEHGDELERRRTEAQAAKDAEPGKLGRFWNKVKIKARRAKNKTKRAAKMAVFMPVFFTLLGASYVTGKNLTGIRFC